MPGWLNTCKAPGAREINTAKTRLCFCRHVCSYLHEWFWQIELKTEQLLAEEKGGQPEGMAVRRDL